MLKCTDEFLLVKTQRFTDRIQAWIGVDCFQLGWSFSVIFLLVMAFVGRTLWDYVGAAMMLLIFRLTFWDARRRTRAGYLNPNIIRLSFQRKLNIVLSIFWLFLPPQGFPDLVFPSYLFCYLLASCTPCPPSESKIRKGWRWLVEATRSMGVPLPQGA